MYNYGEIFSLKNKSAVVTGGAGILGKHFCAVLAQFGAQVAVVDKDGRAAGELAERIAEEYRVKSIGIACDVSVPSAVQGMVAQVCERFGGIDILLNNAASKGSNLESFFMSSENYSFDTWRDVMSVNIDGMFAVAQAVGGDMIRQNRPGVIVQTASIYGIMAPDQRIYENSFYLGGRISTPAVYSASKAAVVGLTKHLAAEWAAHGIRVNALVPGGVESGQNDEFSKRYSARVPLGRMARASDMVGPLVFLVSEASSYVTGQVLAVDGGLSCW